MWLFWKAEFLESEPPWHVGSMILNRFPSPDGSAQHDRDVIRRLIDTNLGASSHRPSSSIQTPRRVLLCSNAQSLERLDRIRGRLNSPAYSSDYDQSMLARPAAARYRNRIC